MKIKYFTQEQMKQIYYILDQDPEDPANVLIELLAQTGVRTEELMRCRVMNFDHKSNRLTVHVAAKGSESRTCPLGFRLSNRLMDCIEAKKLRPIDFIGNILSTRARHESLARMLRTKFDRIKACLWPGQKLPCLHGFRHTTAKKIYEKTKDIYAVKMALGHVSVMSTERYMTSINHEQIHNILAERY
jgi:integrase